MRPEKDPRSLRALENVIYRRIAKDERVRHLTIREVELSAIATAKTLP